LVLFGNLAATANGHYTSVAIHWLFFDGSVSRRKQVRPFGGSRRPVATPGVGGAAELSKIDLQLAIVARPSKLPAHLATMKRE
jgi:hypothetical protein